MLQQNGIVQFTIRQTEIIQIQLQNILEYESGMVLYRKAIRDKIPDIIKKSGNSCNVKKLSDDEFLPELEKKLREEVEEYLKSKSVEELADAVEVIYRIAELKGISNEKLEMLREEKASKRGKFSDNLFLVDATEEEHVS